MENCDHKWKRSPILIDTNPPICHRECQKCGKKDHTDYAGQWTGRACWCQEPIKGALTSGE
jgi:hypothetical protein